jgi:hypothetical protein
MLDDLAGDALWVEGRDGWGKEASFGRGDQRVALEPINVLYILVLRPPLTSFDRRQDCLAEAYRYFAGGGC